MKIAVFTKLYNHIHENTLNNLIQFLSAQNIETSVYSSAESHILQDGITFFNSSEELISLNPDFVFSLGGDGTLLDSILLIRDSKIPVLGINTGRLGFLANNQMNQLDQIIASLRQKQYNIEERTLVELQSHPDLFNKENYALNEFTIHKGDSSSLVKITVVVNQELFNTYWCDGLILSTPTGSTAYSMSCGGPIVFPQSNTFILTPVAPHNLNVRPVILPDDAEFSFTISGRNRKYLISLDSRYRTIDDSVQLSARKAPFKIFTIRFNNQNFSKVIREKLNWGLDQRNT
ncbi:MAG TPA: NAD kinase [Bacteroidia bacterium]|nr:NAD kinase [Sphingobacteriales bacterium]HPD65766.1 NAD kinase [Bacteroidia bacterium]HRS59507.1 NAD kinase [Bacteroidia bacterium]HRU67601.1 NAD kinase [Bacteroidia bacterium]